MRTANTTTRLPDQSFQTLTALYDLYRAEARKCRKAGAYLAGCVMMGSALEAALLAMAECYPKEVKAWADAKREKRGLNTWGLGQLIELARELGWLPISLKSRSKRAADYATVFRMIRNLVHPGRYISDYPGESVDREHLDLCYDVVESVVDHLLTRLGP